MMRVQAFLRRKVKTSFNVVGVSPQTPVGLPTHADMSEGELAEFDRTLALFCPACRKAHQFARADLSLDHARTEASARAKV